MPRLKQKGENQHHSTIRNLVFSIRLDRSLGSKQNTMSKSLQLKELQKQKNWEDQLRWLNDPINKEHHCQRDREVHKRRLENPTERKIQPERQRSP